MAMLKRLTVALGLFSGWLVSPLVHAECGGNQQCIAVSIDPAVGPSHGTPLVSSPLDFGDQSTGTTSANRTILVAAVTGPAGSQATLDSITLSGANAAEFTISGGTCTTGTPSLLHDGANQAQLANACSITVTFSPSSLGTKSAQIDVVTAAITRTVPLAGIGIVPGTRRDPSLNPVVRSLISSQGATAKRFARTQIANLQQRMESLHRGARSTDVASAGAGRSGVGLKPAYRPRVVSLPGELPELGSAPGGSGLVPTSLLASVMSAAATRSLALASASAGSAGADGTGIWVGGNLHFGTRGATEDTSSQSFKTSGVSAGVDRRFTDTLAAGIGVGYARDKTDLGADGSSIRSSGSSIAAYASYQPTRSTYVDGLIGYGKLDFDSTRFVPPANDFARADRAGTQVFGSLAAGYEYRRRGVLLSPYARFDITNDRLEEATETGAGTNALTYFEQTVQTRQVSLGLRAESSHAMRYGWVQPRARLEFKRDLESDDPATIAYADQFAGPRYSLTPVATERNSWLTGIGSDFLLGDGLKLSFDYQLERTRGSDRSQAFRFWLVKDLDAKGFPPGLASPLTFDDPVRVEAAAMRDDNLNRASRAQDKLADNVYSVNVGKSTAFYLTRYSRWVLSGFVSGERLYTYSGLNRVSAGAQAELQYRTSADFSAPTFGLFVRAARDDYHSELRDGSRSSLGFSVRQSLTDRIDAFGAIARNMRRARNDTFDGMDSSARFNLDYSLRASGTLYLGGEYRRGDLVSSGPPSAESAAIARVVADDDAYGGSPLLAYRYEAKTVIWTLGYNWPLGPRDSIDFSARQARSTPISQPDPAAVSPYPSTGGADAAGTSQYTANQYSIAYLMRF